MNKIITINHMVGDHVVMNMWYEIRKISERNTMRSIIPRSPFDGDSGLRLVKY